MCKALLGSKVGALPNNSGTIAKDIANLCWVMEIGDLPVSDFGRAGAQVAAMSTPESKKKSGTGH
jgi:hypothetical protein